jgi:DNA repair protein RadD
MLRPYQKKVLAKMLWAKNLEGNDVVSVSQGGGKTWIIAELAKSLDQPILILAPSKELVEQDLDKLKMAVDESEIGVYSASLNSKEVKRYTIATIQSAYKHPEMFKHYTVVVVDECDTVPVSKLGSMYRKFFKEIGNPKVYGLTGTPFRQDVYYEYPPGYKGYSWQKRYIKAITTTKMINRYRERFWNRILAVVSTKYLTDEGYLSPLEYHDVSILQHEQIPTNKSQSDFDMDRLDEMLENRYGIIAQSIEALPHESKIVYCSSIKQAKALQRLINGSMVVTSETGKRDREAATNGLRSGQIKTLLNVGIYTVGFDYPELECIVILRPTRSLRLHCQILGRVARKAEGKIAGHVYDFVSNVKNLGKLENIKIEKVGGKWNVTSDAQPSGFHDYPLFEYKLKQSKQ